MIEVKNLNKYYNKGKQNEIHVINNTSFTLPDNGLISFLGQSGSGKTTLLNVIGGLDRATGSISYDGLLVTNSKMNKIDSFRREEIGYVFQNYNLLLEESVYNNLVIALEMINIYDKAEQDRRIEYVLKSVGMYKYRKKKAGALSGGQQQRVSIARALVKNSKIIIADEPTGNLDHENTINIMNILKNISRSTLVLMVTHNEEIASFYSDTIYTIKDGSILDKYSPEGERTISNKEGNTVYLKDLKHSTLANEAASLDLYTEASKPINIRIIERNGTYYIDSDSSNIKLLEGSNLRLLDKHYEKITANSLEEVSYDTSWFSRGSRKRNIFRTLINSIRASYNNMRAKSKKTKVLYFSFGLIGVIFAISAIAISNYLVVDDSNVVVDDSLYTLKNTDLYNYYSINQEVIRATHDGYIRNTSSAISLNGYIDSSINIFETGSISIPFMAINYSELNHRLIKGSAPLGKNELAISKGLADKIIKESGKYIASYQDILGLNIYIRLANDELFNFKIAGINDNKYELGYLNDFSYTNMLADLAPWDNTNVTEIFRSRELEGASYKIIYGRDIDPNNPHECLLNSGLNRAVGDYIVDKNGNEYRCVGIYESEYAGVDFTEAIINDTVEVNYNDAAIYPVEYTSYSLVAGNKPKDNSEILASCYSKYNIGDMVSFNGTSFRVVGLYNSKIREYGVFIGTRDLSAVSSYMNAGYGIYFNLAEGLKSLPISDVHKNSVKADLAVNIIIDGLREDQMDNLIIFGGLAGILIAVIIVFIYFIMRSRIISEIYSIGVYRSLGAKKGKIYLRYLFDILVLTTLTAVVGYLITLLIYSAIAGGVNSLAGMNGLRLSTSISALGLLILYLLNITFGMLPIILLMRHRPAEILSKYDI